METFTASQGVSVPSGIRKRGRPAGKGRTPLSVDERRQRNAQYEKERRVAMGVALAELARSANLNPDMTPVDLLAEVVSFIKASTQSQKVFDTDALKRCNVNLATQIATLERRLAMEPEQAGCMSHLPPQSSQTPAKKRRQQVLEPPFPLSKRFAPYHRDAVQYHGLADALHGHTTSTCQLSPLSTCTLSYPEPSCQSRPMMSTTQPLFDPEGVSSFVPCAGFSPHYCHTPSQESQGDAKAETSLSDPWADLSDILSASPPQLGADCSGSWAVEDFILEHL